MSEMERARLSVRAAMTDACRGLVNREVLVELVVLAAVAGEHLLVVGPPGTAKSQAVRRIATRLGGQYFEYLVGSFTEPSELFGPVSLQRLREGVVETETKGMLPEADVAFLDEVFLGSTAILNTLLGLLNERVFRRGHTRLSVPLRVCVGASNRLPDDPQLLAFADRFLLRTFVEPIADSGLEGLLAASRQDQTLGAPGAITDLDVLSRAATSMSLSPVQPQLAEAVRVLRHGGIDLSDRRIVRAQQLVAAAAVLGGRVAPTVADLWPLVFALPTAEAQDLGRQLLRPLLSGSANDALGLAALAASAGPLARAGKLVDEANALLEVAPEAEELARWRRRIEGLLRDIDAAFDPSALPEALGTARERLKTALTEPMPLKP